MLKWQGIGQRALQIDGNGGSLNGYVKPGRAVFVRAVGSDRAGRKQGSKGRQNNRAFHHIFLSKNSVAN